MRLDTDFLDIYIQSRSTFFYVASVKSRLAQDTLGPSLIPDWPPQNRMGWCCIPFSEVGTPPLPQGFISYSEARRILTFLSWLLKMAAPMCEHEAPIIFNLAALLTTDTSPSWPWPYPIPPRKMCQRDREEHFCCRNCWFLNRIQIVCLNLKSTHFLCNKVPIVFRVIKWDLLYLEDVGISDLLQKQAKKKKVSLVSFLLFILV